MTKSGVMDMEYRYTAGVNNGRITQAKDWVTGEEVSYQYDSVNRLTRAETTDSAWGNAYTYDGWGNLTSKSVTKGTAPTLSVNYDPALNMQAGSNPPSTPYQWWEYFDIEDRPLRGNPAIWQASPPLDAGRVAYDPSGKKIFWRGPVVDTSTWETYTGCELDFYAITGKKLARYKCKSQPGNEEETVGNWEIALYDRTQHVGGQVTTWNGGAATTDRLGSLRARGTERYTYFPYGEARTATVSGGGVYAGLEMPLRNYDSGKGRFDWPDPLGLGAVKMGDPGSWNRFAYVQGDPVNYMDPEGLFALQVSPGMVISVPIRTSPPSPPVSGGTGSIGAIGGGGIPDTDGARSAFEDAGIGGSGNPCAWANLTSAQQVMLSEGQWNGFSAAWFYTGSLRSYPTRLPVGTQTRFEFDQLWPRWASK